jgi:hypothetical protein
VSTRVAIVPWFSSQSEAAVVEPRDLPQGTTDQLANEPTSMRKPDQVPGALQLSLTHQQMTWLRVQAQAMNISDEALSGRILNEWLSNHPDMLLGKRDAKEIIRQALDEFIRRHSAEFLPVSV